MTIQFLRDGTCVEEFSLPVTTNEATQIQNALNESVLTKERDGLIVTLDLSRRVPDVIRYWVKEETWANEDNTTWMDHPKTPKRFPWGRPPRRGETGGILILLESPHRDEVSAELEPLVPAAGSTGRRLESHKDALLYLLTRKLGLTFTDNQAPVIIGNPLQFPASLRTRPLALKLRDEIWIRAMLRTRFQRDLFRRLNMYKPKIIINACTGKLGERSSPKAITRYFIDEYLSRSKTTHIVRTTFSPKSHPPIETSGVLETAECHVVEVAHPSGWRWNPNEWFPDDGDYSSWLHDR
ncbi:hypothetical protein ACN47A_00960 [Myxococcus fulvus]|uniref:hypothetical protein n=1 Tax=Myxococcus fulvus TaxID=33 RepID=UPI003B99CD94